MSRQRTPIAFEDPGRLQFGGVGAGVDEKTVRRRLRASFLDSHRHEEDEALNEPVFASSRLARPVTPLELLAAAKRTGDIRRVRGAARARPGTPIGRKGLAIVADVGGSTAANATAAASATATAAALAAVVRHDAGARKRLPTTLCGPPDPTSPAERARAAVRVRASA